jgi:uncharacterized protein involved in type VI secretion and phage assembly
MNGMASTKSTITMAFIPQSYHRHRLHRESAWGRSAVRRLGAEARLPLVSTDDVDADS